MRFRPFYLPREFTVIVITAVYIPPRANITTALGYLLTAISKQQQAHPDGVFIIAGDFNRASLKTVLPKFHQHVKCPTRGKNILDHVYSNIKHGYKASPLPNLGLLDHISLFLTPAYRPLINRVKPSVKTIQIWPEGSSGQLQDCFSRTDWTVFLDDVVYQGPNQTNQDSIKVWLKHEEPNSTKGRTRQQQEVVNQFPSSCLTEYSLTSKPFSQNG